MAIEKPRLRCRIGWHRWTVVPRDILDAARAAGLRSHPDWYVGRRTAEYCLHCGVRRYPAERSRLADLVIPPMVAAPVITPEVAETLRELDRLAASPIEDEVADPR
jgi:hypothetical protein